MLLPAIPLLHGWALLNGADILRGGEIDPDLIPPLPDAPLAIDEADRAPEVALLHLLNSSAEAGQTVKEFYSYHFGNDMKPSKENLQLSGKFLTCLAFNSAAIPI